MRHRSERTGRLLLIACVALLPAFANAQLNPTVKVLPRANAPVPPDCDQSVAPQPPPPRITAEEKAIVRDTTPDMQPPPSVTLRGELRRAVEAAQTSDRGSFADALARAKSLIGTYPSGAERNAATDLISVLNDVDTIWNYQFTSPTGAFFDASGDVFKIASRYPGWEASVRRQVIVDANGTKFYPTRETRDFIVNEAASRLSRLTGQPVARQPAPPKRERIEETPSSHRTPAASTETHAAKPRSTPTTIAPKATNAKPPVKRAERRTVTRTHRRATHAAPATSQTNVTKRAAAHTAATKPAVTKSATTAHAVAPPHKTETAKTTTPSRTETPARSMSGATAPPAKRSAAAVTAPSAATSTATSTQPPSTTSSAAETTAPTDTMVAQTATQAETTTTAAPTPVENAAKPKAARSFFWPIVLIVAGLCALVLLLRASS